MKTKFLYSFIAFLAAFILYALTAAPDLMFTDAGELAASAVTLGVAHPTGYPLFIILGHLWSWLPLPLVMIHKMNLFSAFVTAIGVGLNCALLILILEKSYDNNIKPLFIRLASLFSSLILGLGGIVWGQATSIEVYSLQFLLINLNLLVFFKAAFSNSERYLLLGSFVLGLSFANHMTTLLLIPAILYIVFAFPEKKFSLKRDKKILLWMAVLFFTGLSLYLYLPVRSMTGPLFDWGDVDRSFSKLWYHISGKQYQVWMFPDKNTWSSNFGKFIDSLGSQFPLYGFAIIFLLFAAVYAFRANAKILVVSIILVVSCLLYSLNYSIHDIETYFITAYVGLILLLPFLISVFPSSNAKYYRSSQAVSILVLFISVVSLIQEGLKKSNQSDNYLVPEYTRILAENLEPNAIVISSQWDYWVPAFWYKQKIEGYRIDIALIEKELLRRTWYLNQIKNWNPKEASACSSELNDFLVQLELFESGGQYNGMLIQSSYINAINCFISSNIDKRPVYITFDVMTSEPAIGAEFVKIPQGFAIKLERENKILPVDFSKLDISKFKSSLKGREDHLSKGIAETAAYNFVNIGRYAAFTGRDKEANLAFKKALELDPQNREALSSIKR